MSSIRRQLLALAFVLAAVVLLVRLGDRSSSARVEGSPVHGSDRARLGAAASAGPGDAHVASDVEPVTEAGSSARATADGVTFVVRGLGEGDPAPTPCAGARVALHRRWPPAPGQPAERAVTADARGIATLALEPPALALVTAEGFIGDVVMVMDRAATHQEVTLDRLAALRVRVLTAGGEPVEGARVEVAYAPVRSNAAVTGNVRGATRGDRGGEVPGDMRATTRATFARASALLHGGPEAVRATRVGEAAGDGTFAASDLVPGLPLSVTVTDPVLGATTRTISALAAGADRTIDVELEQRGAIRLTVLDHAGRPLPEAEVSLFQEVGISKNGEGTVQSDAEGVATFAGVRRGDYHVSVRGWSPSGSDLYLLAAHFEVTGPGVRDLGALRPEGLCMAVHLDPPDGDEGGRSVRASFSPRNTPDLEPGTFRYAVHDARVPLGRTFQVWADAGAYTASFTSTRPSSRALDLTLTHIEEEVRCPGSYRFAFERRSFPEPSPYLQLHALPADFVTTGPQQVENVVLLVSDSKVESMFADLGVETGMVLTLRSRAPGRHRLIGLLGGRAHVHGVDAVSGQVLRVKDLHAASAAPLEFSAVWEDGSPVTYARARMVSIDFGGHYEIPQEVDFAFEGSACLRLPDGAALVLEFVEGDRVGRATLTGEPGTTLRRVQLALRSD